MQLLNNRIFNKVVFSWTKILISVVWNILFEIEEEKE